MDAHVTRAGFHQKIGVPFFNSFLNEIEAAFDMESIEPVQALLALDLLETPTADDTSFVMYGSEKLKFCFHSMVRKGQRLMQAVPSLV